MFARLALHNAVPGKTAGWNVGGRRSGQPTCWRTAAWTYRQNKLVALAISLGVGVAVLDDHLLNSCQYGSKVQDAVTTTCRFLIRCAATAGQCALMQHEPWQIKAGVGRNTQAPKFLKTASQRFSVARPLGIASTTLLAVGANLLISLHHYMNCPVFPRHLFASQCRRYRGVNTHNSTRYAACAQSCRCIRAATTLGRRTRVVP